MMMSGYDFEAYVRSIARREPRRLPALSSVLSAVWYLLFVVRNSAGIVQSDSLPVAH